MCTARFLSQSASMGRLKKFRSLKDIYDATDSDALSQPLSLQSLSCEGVAAITGVGTGNFTNETSEAKNSESQAVDRASDPCEDIELLLNIRKNQLAGESREDVIDLIKFDNGRISNQPEKRILVGDVSCICGSDRTYLSIADTQFDRSEENQHDFQNFIKNPPQEGVVCPILFDYAISSKIKPIECSGEQVASSPARVALSEISQIDGAYDYPTIRIDDPHLNSEDSAVETENPLYCKKHLQNSSAAIEVGGQSMQVGLVGMSDIMENEVRVCDICGDAGREELLAICSKCPDGAEHIYCMRIMLDRVPEVGVWTCEECIQKTDTKKPTQDKIERTARISVGRLECHKPGSSVNIESRTGSKFIAGSSCAGRTGTNDVSSTFPLSAKRQGIHLKAQSAKKARITGISAVLPRSPKPCNKSLLHRDYSFNNLKMGEMKATKEITSELQSSSNALEKAKVLGACGERRHMGTLKAELDKKRKNHEPEVVSPKASNTRKNSQLHRDISFKKLKKGEVKAPKEISSVLQTSYNEQEKAKVPCARVDKRHVETVKTDFDKKRRDFETKVLPTKGSKTVNNSLLHKDSSFKNVKEGETKTSKEIASMLQVSCNCLEKVQFPSACGVIKGHVETSKAALDKRRDLNTEVKSTNVSNRFNRSLLCGESSFKNLEKEKVEAARSVCSPKQSSYGTQEKAKLPSILGPKPSKLCLQTEISRDKSTNVSNKFNRSLLCGESSFKNLEKEKVEAARSVCSPKQSSYGTQEKAKLPSILGPKPSKLCLQTEISRDKCSLLKSRSSSAVDLKLKGQLPKGFPLKVRSSNAADLGLKGQLVKSGSLQKQAVARNSDFQDKKKQTDPRALSKYPSFNNVSSDKLNATGSEVLLANAGHLETLKKLNHEKDKKMVKGKVLSELHIPEICSPVSDVTLNSKRETMPCDDAFNLESNDHNLDPVRSCGLSNCSSKPSSNISHKPASDEGSGQGNLPLLDAEMFSEAPVIPKPDCIWLGKFQLHRGEGLASLCDGIQAHVSTFASPRVSEVAEKLPEIITLEELPRLKTWPSQFIENQATEDNIALYFFATNLESYRAYYRNLLDSMTKNDLALRGNLDGFELLIFSSIILPEKSQHWNKLLFLWGVFRGRRINNSANMPLSNSLKDKNSESRIVRPFDLNAYPEEWEDTEGIEESGILKFEPTADTGGGFLLGDSSGFTDWGQALDTVEKNKEVIDLELSLWPKSAKQEDGVKMSMGMADGKMHGKPWVEVGKASTSGCREEREIETKELLLEWQAADTLLSLSKDKERFSF